MARAVVQGLQAVACHARVGLVGLQATVCCQSPLAQVAGQVVETKAGARPWHACCVQIVARSLQTCASQLGQQHSHTSPPDHTPGSSELQGAALDQTHRHCNFDREVAALSRWGTGSRAFEAAAADETHSRWSTGSCGVEVADADQARGHLGTGSSRVEVAALELEDSQKGVQRRAAATHHESTAS